MAHAASESIAFHQGLGVESVAIHLIIGRADGALAGIDIGVAFEQNSRLFRGRKLCSGDQRRKQEEPTRTHGGLIKNTTGGSRGRVTDRTHEWTWRGLQSAGSRLVSTRPAEMSLRTPDVVPAIVCRWGK